MVNLLVLLCCIAFPASFATSSPVASRKASTSDDPQNKIWGENPQYNGNPQNKGKDAQYEAYVTTGNACPAPSTVTVHAKAYPATVTHFVTMTEKADSEVIQRVHNTETLQDTKTLDKVTTATAITKTIYNIVTKIVHVITETVSSVATETEQVDRNVTETLHNVVTETVHPFATATESLHVVVTKTDHNVETKIEFRPTTIVETQISERPVFHTVTYTVSQVEPNTVNHIATHVSIALETSTPTHLMTVTETVHGTLISNGPYVSTKTVHVTGTGHPGTVTRFTAFATVLPPTEAVFADVTHAPNKPTLTDMTSPSRTTQATSSTGPAVALTTSSGTEVNNIVPSRSTQAVSSPLPSTALAADDFLADVTAELNQVESSFSMENLVPVGAGVGVSAGPPKIGSTDTDPIGTETLPAGPPVITDWPGPEA